MITVKEKIINGIQSINNEELLEKFRYASYKIILEIQ
jgi:hypothetical protein